MDIDLQEQASVTFDSSGNGTASIGPTNQFQVWTVTNIGISSANGRAGTVTDEASCKVFRGTGTSGGQFTGGTLSGSSGDSNDVTVTLYPGMKLIANWQGGDAHDVGTMALTGTNTVPG